MNKNKTFVALSNTFKRKYLLLIMILQLTNFPLLFAQEIVPADSVYLQDLCNELTLNRNYILLDVRSQGEYSDTSGSAQLNLGKFKNAVNIDIAELEKRISELEQYKDNDIFVYCSHSSRSRVACGILEKQGFRKVHNVNGGISEWVYGNFVCSELFYENSLPYMLYTPEKLIASMNDPNIVIVDIRDTEDYLGTSASENRNIGKLNKNHLHIPHDELGRRINELGKTKKIILCDHDGSKSPASAVMLVKNGFTDVGILAFGFYSWIARHGYEGGAYFENTPDYKNLSMNEALSLITGSGDLVLLDIRTTNEFNSTDSLNYRNLGHFKNAVNIPANEISSRLGELEKFKNRGILVYDFSGSGRSAEISKTLSERGYTKVYNFISGIYRVTWSRKNIKGFVLPEGLIVK